MIVVVSGNSQDFLRISGCHQTQIMAGYIWRMYSNVGAVTHSGYSISKNKERDGEKESSKDSGLTREEKHQPISSRLLKFIKRRINPVVGKFHLC